MWHPDRCAGWAVMHPGRVGPGGGAPGCWANAGPPGAGSPRPAAAAGLAGARWWRMPWAGWRRQQQAPSAWSVRLIGEAGSGLVPPFRPAFNRLLAVGQLTAAQAEALGSRPAGRVGATRRPPSTQARWRLFLEYAVRKSALNGWLAECEQRAAAVPAQRWFLRAEQPRAAMPAD